MDKADNDQVRILRQLLPFVAYSLIRIFAELSVLRLATLMITLLLTAALSACNHPSQPLRVGTNLWPGYELLYLAREQGSTHPQRLRGVVAGTQGCRQRSEEHTSELQSRENLV